MNERIVLITGAGSGIGRALALEADRRDHRVVLVGRRAAALEETAAQLTRQDVVKVPADIITSEGRLAAVAAVKEIGGLDVLINNAGLVLSGPLAGSRDDDVERLLMTNVAAPIALSRELLPMLVARRGQVVNMGSMFGDIAFPYFTAYSASKFALRGFSDALRREVKRHGVDVTYLAPRATRTAAADDFAALVEPMGMVLDAPEAVAAHAWRAIESRKSTQYPASRERLFVALQRLRPRLIDNALSKMAADPRVARAAGSRD